MVPFEKLKQLAQRFINRPHPNNTQAEQFFESASIRHRHYDSIKSERLSLACSDRSLRRTANLTRQTNFAKYRRVRINRLIAKAGRNSRHQTEIDCRFVDFQSAGNIHEYVVPKKLHSRALF